VNRESHGSIELPQHWYTLNEVTVITATIGLGRIHYDDPLYCDRYAFVLHYDATMKNCFGKPIYHQQRNST
jgi:hypothetical protein